MTPIDSAVNATVKTPLGIRIPLILSTISLSLFLLLPMLSALQILLGNYTHLTLTSSWVYPTFIAGGYIIAGLSWITGLWSLGNLIFRKTKRDKILSLKPIIYFFVPLLIIIVLTLITSDGTVDSITALFTYFPLNQFSEGLTSVLVVGSGAILIDLISALVSGFVPAIIALVFWVICIIAFVIVEIISYRRLDKPLSSTEAEISSINDTELSS